MLVLTDMSVPVWSCDSSWVQYSLHIQKLSVLDIKMQANIGCRYRWISAHILLGLFPYIYLKTINSYIIIRLFTVHYFWTILISICSQVQITEDVRQYLRKPTFDNWQWDEPEMLVLLQQMYIDLGFVTKFKIEVSSDTHNPFFFNQRQLISFLFLQQNICCGYSLEVPHWGTSDEYPQHMLLWRNKDIHTFWLEKGILSGGKHTVKHV